MAGRRKGPLSTAARKALPAQSFALPGRRYPIPDRSHAANALARVAQHGSPAEQARVKAAVRKKYPSMGRSGAGSSGTRRAASGGGGKAGGSRK